MPSPDKGYHEPVLHVYFWLPRDQIRYEGIASDQIHGEGVEFVTLRNLSLRQLVRLSLAVQPPGGEIGKPTPPLAAEITHIESVKNGWRVYAAFLDTHAEVDIPAEDRRTQPRYPTRLPAEYTLVEGMPPRPCLVEDISRSGAALEVDQGIRLGRHLTLRVFASDKRDAPVFLESIVEVRRSRHKGDGIYDIGVLFLHRRHHPSEGGRAEPPAGSSRPTSSPHKDTPGTDDPPSPELSGSGSAPS